MRASNGQFPPKSPLIWRVNEFERGVRDVRTEFALANRTALFRTPGSYLDSEEESDERFTRNDDCDVHLVPTVATGGRLDRDVRVSNRVSSSGDALTEFGDGDIDRILWGGDVVDDPRNREGHFVPIRVSCWSHEW